MTARQQLYDLIHDVVQMYHAFTFVKGQPLQKFSHRHISVFEIEMNLQQSPNAFELLVLSLQLIRVEHSWRLLTCRINIRPPVEHSMEASFPQGLGLVQHQYSTTNHYLLATQLKAPKHERDKPPGVRGVGIPLVLVS